MLDRVIEEEGAAAVRDLNSFTIDEHILLILLKRRSYHTSAQLLSHAALADDVRADGASRVIEKDGEK